MHTNDRLTLNEAATLAGYRNTGSLRHAIQRGTLRAEKHGRDWFTTRAWLAAYLAQRPTRKHDGRGIDDVE